MSQTGEFLKRVAERTGYSREFFVESKMPSAPSNVVAVPFYGDLRSLCILSSLILKPYKELHPEKYLILCSWPGFHGLFSYVDEYWCIEDESVAKKLATEANNFYNGGNLSSELSRSLIENMNVLTMRDLKEYYDCGLTKKYFDELTVTSDNIGTCRLGRYLPEVPSASKLSQMFLNEMERQQGRKVFVYPVTRMWSWQRGKAVYLPVPKLFWETMLNSLLAEGYVPVLYQNWFTYDMSSDFAQKCIYLVPRNVSDVLAAMRHVGLVLDVYSGISKLAMAARTPFLAVDERQRYVSHRDYEIDDLCATAPKQYLFSFSTMLMAGGPDDWKNSIIDGVMVRLKKFVPTLEDTEWGSTNESYEAVDYGLVRERKAKRLGAVFINSSKTK